MNEITKGKLLSVLNEAISQLSDGGDDNELAVLSILHSVRGAVYQDATKELTDHVLKFTQNMLAMLYKVRHEYTGTNWIFGAKE